MEFLASGALALADPTWLLMLTLGVLLGLTIGVIPGIGSLFGLTILIPVTYGMDPIPAFALLLGMASVTTTSDTIPAVLIGVPGTVGAAATAVDGHELAKNRQAARALGAAYSASLIGGVFGALVLALSLPVLRDAVLLLTYADLFAITAFGMTLVAMLAGKNPLKGLLAACTGALVAFAGLDPLEGAERWTFGQVYLWDGIPVAIVFLGIFGISELADLIRRGQVQVTPEPPEPGGLMRGIRDTLRNWPLVLRSSSIGAILGAVPGIGVTVIEWVAYGDAARRPGKGEPPFGKGNIRAVIAPESANNSKEGGALMPTLAFGIPGSATMAILLGAFGVHGIVPGPDMLDSHADLVVSMVMAVALANVMGAAICLGLTRQLAKVATIPATTLVPFALVFLALGAFQVTKDPRDFIVLLLFGALGLAMKRLDWSRPAFALGFVLAPNLERFFHLTTQISGSAWATRPVFLVLAAIVLAMWARRFSGWQQGRRSRAPSEMVSRRAIIGDLILAGLLGTIAAGCLAVSLDLPGRAGEFPIVVAGCGLVLVILLCLGLVARLRTSSPGIAGKGGAFAPDALFLAGIAGLTLCVLSLGHLAGPVAFMLGAAAVLRGPSLPKALLATAIAAAIIFAVFDLIVSQAWPDPWLNILLPGLIP